MGRSARPVVIVVCGALGLTACDLLHVLGGTLSYVHPGPFGQAWWVPLEFTLATVAMLAGAALFAGDRPAPAPAGREVATAALWFAAAYAASALAAPEHPWALAGGLWVLALARIAHSSDRRALVPFAVLLAVSGCATELAISATGAFEYAGPDGYVVPWLSALYVIGAPLALALARLLPAGSVLRAARR
ncbi:MAG: hypothetical protein ACR2NH_01160 [Solirubrobacteraceae bacterium]